MCMQASLIYRTIQHLKDNYPTDKKPIWVICTGYDCIESPEGEMGFGVFIPETLEIYIATDVPQWEETLIETTAHEYKHFMQYCEGEPFDEEEAECFAYMILAEMKEKEI